MMMGMRSMNRRPRGRRNEDEQSSRKARGKRTRGTRIWSKSGAGDEEGSMEKYSRK